MAYMTNAISQRARMPLNYYPYEHLVAQGFNVANGLAAMYHLYIPPELEAGP